MDIVSIATYAMDVLMNVDRLPGEDGFAVVTNNTYMPGGSGTNVLVQAARLGASCGFLGLVGDDSIGDDILASLRAESIDDSRVLRKQDGVSLHTDIVVDAEGKKFILLNMGNAFLAYDAASVDREYIAKGKVYYTDLLPFAPAFEGLRAAKAAGLRTGFNMQVDLPSMNGFGASKQDILDSLQYVDLFAPCRAGLFQLCGSEDLDACLSFLRPYFKGTLLVTLGKKGSAAFDTADRRYDCSIADVQVVDTTGAGDAFMGGMLYAFLLRGMPLDKALEFSTVCAGITCTALGARSSPSLAEVEKQLGK
ncbi:MAG: carbohydrate kinase family protein [Oscillospiraceae bacterium]|nr:carbohydrate kinase family protein [Oscillospiraceae bacterium]